MKMGKIIEIEYCECGDILCTEQEQRDKICRDCMELMEY